MVNIYILFIRSFLEQSSVVWHYDITEEEISDIERVQKVACKVILGQRYTDYPSALHFLSLQSLKSRREELCLRFAKKCLRQEKTKSMFPLNTNQTQLNLRDTKKVHVQFVSTTRLLKSCIPSMQRALNSDSKC